MSFFQRLFGPPNIEKLKAKRDVKGLIEALDYERDISVRQAATKALGEIGDEQAIDPLIETLKNKDMRQATAEALIEIGIPAVESLAKALKDKDRDIHEIVVEILDKLNWQPKVHEFKAIYWMIKRQRKKCATAFYQTARFSLAGARAVDPLVTVLKDKKDEDMRKFAIGVLGQIGVQSGINELSIRVAEVLINCIRDQHQSVRDEAIRALKKMSDIRIIEPLVAALKDEDENVRKFVIQILPKIGVQLEKTEEVERLIIMLEDEDLGRSTDAAKQLGQIGDIRAVKPLCKALFDKRAYSEYKRIAAAKALGEIGDPSAAHSLVHILKGTDRKVKEAAVESLKTMGSSAVKHISGMLELKYNDRRTAMAAARALGEIGAPQALRPLIAALKSEDGGVSNAAAEALGEIGDQQAVESLIDTFDTNKHQGYKCSECIEALGQIGGSRATEALTHILEYDTYPNHKFYAYAAAKALGQIGDPQTVESLIAALKYPDSKVNEAAATALGQIGDSRAVEVLIAALDKSWLMEAVATALGQIGDSRAVEALISTLEYTGHRDGQVRISAAKALSEITGQEFNKDITHWRQWWEEQK